MRKSIDLNADLGEGMPAEAALLAVVSSCNVACGGHCGDHDSMSRTVAAAAVRAVAIGAHPSYPDRDGFGRRSRFVDAAVLAASLRTQLEAFMSVVRDHGAELRHVKPHGALYNDAARDESLAAVIGQAAARLPGTVALVGPAGSALQAAAADEALPFVAEAFADRVYLDDGTLQPRSEPGAVISAVDRVQAQALLIAVESQVETASGRRLAIAADTLCIHGDTPNAAHIGTQVRHALEAAGVVIAAP